MKYITLAFLLTLGFRAQAFSHHHAAAADPHGTIAPRTLTAPEIDAGGVVTGLTFLGFACMVVAASIKPRRP
jgi:hypothetical protein